MPGEAAGKLLRNVQWKHKKRKNPFYLEIEGQARSIYFNMPALTIPQQASSTYNGKM